MNAKRIHRTGRTARRMRRALGRLFAKCDLTTERRLIAERKARRLRHTGHWHAVASFWRQPDRYLGRTPDQVMRARSRLYDEYCAQDGDAGADAFWGGDLNVTFHTPAGWVEVAPSAVYGGLYWFQQQHPDLMNFNFAGHYRPGPLETFAAFCEWEDYDLDREAYDAAADYFGVTPLQAEFDKFDKE